MEWHSHSFLQLIHIIEGEFSVDFGKGWLRVPPGAVHILSPGSTHRLHSIGGHLQFGLNFSTVKDERGLLQQLLDSFTTPAIHRCVLPATLKRMLANPVFVTGIVEELCLCQIFDDYCLRLLQSLEPGEKEKKKQELLSILGDCSANPLTVNELALRMCMSRASLQRFSLENFGCGVHTLHEKVRMENAAYILLSSSSSIGECAYACGYPDIFAFSRSFKRIKGVSPSVFRERALSKG